MALEQLTGHTTPPTQQPPQPLFLLSTQPGFLTSARTDQSFLFHMNLHLADSSWQAFWTLDISPSLTFLSWESGNSGTSLQAVVPLAVPCKMLTGSLLPRTTEQEAPSHGTLAPSWGSARFPGLWGIRFPAALSFLGQTTGNHTGHYLHTWEMMGIRE